MSRRAMLALGRISASVNGNKLIGTWTQKFPCGGASEGNGPMEFTLADDGKSWAGRWRYAHSDVWRTDWNGTSCAAGPCLQNGEEAEEDEVSFRFAAGARHPKNIASPLRHHQGWTTGAAGRGTIVDLSYIEGKDVADSAVRAEFKVVKKQLRTSGPQKTLTLSIVLVSMKAEIAGARTKLPTCREGMRGTVRLIDDDRVLPGGEADRGQTRDEVIVSVSSARCDYLEHTYTNADSLSHTPFVGGLSGSGGPGGRGGQWVDVRIQT